MNNQTRLDQNAARERFYRWFSVIAVAIFAFLFAFPLYWIITGAFKTGAEMAFGRLWKGEKKIKKKTNF